MSASNTAVMDQMQLEAQGRLAGAPPPGSDPGNILQAKEAALDPLHGKASAAQSDLIATPKPSPAALPETPKEPLVDPKQYEQFSFGLIAMALIGGSLAKGNWMGVASTMNGAMKGFLEGNQARAQEDWKRFQADYDKAIEKHREQEEDYAQTINNKKLTINQMLTEIQWKAAKYDDQYKLALARDKRVDELHKQVFDMAKSREELQIRKDAVANAIGNHDDLLTNAKAIANYQEAPPTLSSRNPKGYQVMAEVYKMNPAYDANKFKAKGRGEIAFGSGKQGDTTRSLNVAVQHLNLLDNLGKGLKNTDVQGVNRFYNAIGKEFGRANVTNFETAKTIVADEVVKAVIGAGAGSLADREDLQAKFNSANTPEQLAGVIATAKGLMAGQLKGLRRQYESTTGLTDFDEKLDPETQSALEGTGAEHPADIQTILDKYK